MGNDNFRIYGMRDYAKDYQNYGKEVLDNAELT